MTARSIEDAVVELRSLERAPEAIARAVAPQISGWLESEFAAGKDPYGVPWRALAPSTLARGRKPPPLTDTGRMRASARAAAFGASIVVTVDTPAQFHQKSRPILPDERGLPAAWRQAIDLAAATVERQVA